MQRQQRQQQRRQPAAAEEQQQSSSNVLDLDLVLDNNFDNDIRNEVEEEEQQSNSNGIDYVYVNSSSIRNEVEKEQEQQSSSNVIDYVHVDSLSIDNRNEVLDDEEANRNVRFIVDGQQPGTSGLGNSLENDNSSSIVFDFDNVSIVSGVSSQSIRRKMTARERKRKQLENETEEEKRLRLEKQRDYARRRRANENDNERDSRLLNMRASAQIRRENEDAEERDSRLEQLRDYDIIRRENEDDEERDLRLQRMRANAQIRIENEDDDERDMRLDQQREIAQVNRIRQAANAVRLYAAGSYDNVVEFRLGPMDVECIHCTAAHWSGEKVSAKGNSFGDCCQHGKIRIAEIPEKDFPEVLRKLFMKEDARYRNFFDCIRHLNSSVSMASMNPLRYRYPSNRGPYCFRIYGQIYHKMNIALHPDPRDEPAYGQVFIIDTAQALDVLTRTNPTVSQSLLDDVYRLIKDLNPFAQAYVMMKEEEDEELERARQEDRDPYEIKLLFDTKDRLDRRQGYNVPKANEVAAVYVPGADGDVPDAKVVIRQRGKELMILNSTNEFVTPMTYPLFYPRGTFGWRPGKDSANSDKKVTRLQYVKYSIAYRPGEFNPILYGGKLFQQYCVDEWVKIEADRMRWIKSNQKKICADAYKNVDNFLISRANATGLPPGRKVILPSTVTNSPRYVEKHYQDAMSIVRRFGKPDLFLTMTCNPKWPDIEENLFEGQSASDRPEIVDRVFHLFVKELMKEIVKVRIFGLSICWMYPVENQGRGLPHIHLLLTLFKNDKLLTGEDVDERGIRARIPDEDEDPEYYALVKKFMIHGPCGDLNPSCPCMEEKVDGNGRKVLRCSKGYPKQFQEKTVVLENGLALYARPDDKRTVEVKVRGNSIHLDNRWVVPHVPYLLKRFRCHINVEKVNSVSSVKYLHKYVHKPPDRARFELDQTNDHDEVKDYLDARYVCPQEAVWRILEFPMYDRSHSIVSLPVHLPGEQVCYFDENMTDEEIREKIENGSELLAYFELNKVNALARDLYYHQIPEYFVFRKGQWHERKSHFNTIGRMVKVSPAETERYHLRLLLLNVKASVSYESLRTVSTLNGLRMTIKRHATNAEACLARGLIRDDEEWKKALEEANSFEMPWKLRDFFALILVHCNPAKPEELWNLFKDPLSEDYAQNHSQAIAYSKAYRDIVKRIVQAGKSIADFPTMEQIDLDDDDDDQYNIAEELDKGRRGYQMLYDEQKLVVDEILKKMLIPVGIGFYFVSGPAGTGKTFLVKVLVHLIRGMKKHVSTSAFTGMAATLLPGGRTMHNRFGLSLDMGNSKIGPRSKAWQELKSIDVFICDEAPMIHKRALETIDSKLQEVMQNDIVFGGKILLLSGDFRQTLPIQKHASRSEIVDLTIKKSKFWRLVKRFKLSKNMRALATEKEFAKDLLEIGEGKWNDDNDEIIVPANCISPSGDLAEEIFGHAIASGNWNQMAEMAILAPMNVDVTEMNDKVLNMIPGQETVYTSIDHAEDEEKQHLEEYLDEYLNSLKPQGLPPHELKLKENVIVMLIRNLNIEQGLCNGTRMLVQELRTNLIVCKILSGDNAGQLAYIPRITLCCDGEYPFDLYRHQFPLVIAFAMTINKAQGQTLERVGLDLRKDVFSHGQLYVAFSRIRTWNALKVRLDEKNVDRKIKNIVYKELLDDKD